MELIISKNDRKTLRKYFGELKDYIIIDKVQIISKLGYKSYLIELNKYSQYVINEEIKSGLKKAINNKKNKNVIYIVDSLDRSFFMNILGYIGETDETLQKINKLSLFDVRDELTHLYSFVDEVYQKSSFKDKKPTK